MFVKVVIEWPVKYKHSSTMSTTKLSDIMLGMTPINMDIHGCNTSILNPEGAVRTIYSFIRRMSMIIASQESNLMLASFGFFGHRSWIQLLALTAGFHSSVTIRNFKKLQYKFRRACGFQNLVWTESAPPGWWLPKLGVDTSLHPHAHRHACKRLKDIKIWNKLFYPKNQLFYDLSQKFD